MRIYKPDKKDGEFVFFTIKELMGQTQIDLEPFLIFFSNYLKQDNSVVYIAEVDGERVGLATLNRYPLLRYIGYAYEIEEYVIVEKHRRKGYGMEFLWKLIELFRMENDVRKILVKTNGDESRDLYSHYMNRTEYTTFQTLLNII